MLVVRAPVLADARSGTGLQIAMVCCWSEAALHTALMTGTAANPDSALGRIASRFFQRDLYSASEVADGFVAVAPPHP